MARVCGIVWRAYVELYGACTREGRMGLCQGRSRAAAVTEETQNPKTQNPEPSKKTQAPKT
jgi:hypothetical protein